MKPNGNVIELLKSHALHLHCAVNIGAHTHVRMQIHTNKYKANMNTV